MALMKLVGSRVSRVEDPRFLVGGGCYVDDIQLAGTLHVAFVRSPLAHARIVGIDSAAAREAPGVHAVLTGTDIDGLLKTLGRPYNPEVFPPVVYRQCKWPCLATGKVRYVGELVAVVVAESRYLAEDAAELIQVDYEELPVVTGPADARLAEAPIIHEDIGTNVMMQLGHASEGLDTAFDEAALVVSERFQTNRHTAVPMECRATLAKFDADGMLTLWCSHQMPHLLRTRIADLMGQPEQKIRVIVPDVGGSFGPKAYVYPEDVLTCHLAKMLRRPVKWTEDRRENFVGTHHAKEQDVTCAMAFSADGTLLAMKAGIATNLGAYSGDPFPAPFEALQLAIALPGPYKMRAYGYDLSACWSNKMTVCAYRGVGLTAAVYVQERMMDIAARQLGMDPVALRLKNMIRPEEFPYVSLTGLQYDSGSSTDALEKALAILDYEDFRRRQAQARAEGRHIGIGVSTYIEMTGFGTKFMAAAGIELGMYEAAKIRMEPDGGVLLSVGTLSHGQGHATAFAQIVADELGVDIADVRVVQGDTDATPYGWGTIGSRGAIAGGGAVTNVARALKAKIAKIGARMLQADADQLEFNGGRLQVRSREAASIAIKDIAKVAVYSPAQLGEGETPGLEATYHYDPPPATYANATHVAEVEVDVETGQVRIERYVVVEDCGRMINPMIVDGQIAGGVAQGIGTVLYEHLVYDENCQLLNSSLADYLVPTFTEVPHIEIDHVETPAPATEGGVKGMGEGGAIAPPGAIANAVADALSPFDIRCLELPLTPDRIWAAIEAAKGRSAA